MFINVKLSPVYGNHGVEAAEVITNDGTVFRVELDYSDIEANGALVWTQNIRDLFPRKEVS